MFSVLNLSEKPEEITVISFHLRADNTIRKKNVKIPHRRLTIRDLNDDMKLILSIFKKCWPCRVALMILVPAQESNLCPLKWQRGAH